MDNLITLDYDYISETNFKIECRRINRIVTIDVDISGTTLKTALSGIIIKKPFRPTFYKHCVPIVAWDKLNVTYGILELQSDGTFTSYLWDNNPLVTYHFTITFIN